MKQPARAFLGRGIVVAAAAIGTLAGTPGRAAEPAAPIPGPVSVAGAGHAPLVVVAGDDYPPYLYRDEDGRTIGLLADEWALWARKTGVRVDLRAMNWAQAQVEMAAGHADVIDGIFRTPERDRTLDFTSPYADIPAAIYARSDVGGLTDVRSLHGLRVGASAGDLCVDRLRDGGVTTVEVYPNNQGVIDAALADGPKVFCMDEPAAEYLLYRAGAAARFHQAFVLVLGKVHRAVRHGDAQTLQLVDKGFAAISPQEHDELQDKWLGSPLPGIPWQRALRIAALALILAVVVAVSWVLALRRAVREQTALIDAERRRLRTLINTLPDLIWFKGVDGAFLACNHRFEQFIGATEARLLGHTERNFLPPAVAAELSALDRRAIEAGTPLAYQLKMTYASDGHQELVESLHTPVIGAQGELSGVLSIARDVTQRRDAERLLLRLNRLYQVLTSVHAAIARERTPALLLTAICRIMVDDGGLRMAWIGCPDDTTGNLTPVAWAGVTGGYLEAPHASLATGPLGLAPSVRAFREGRAVHCTDIGNDPSMAPWRDLARELGYCSSSAFPLRAHGRIFGSFTMYSAAVEFFDAGELALLERLSGDIGHALEGYELDAERERAVTALRDSEARFATIFKMSPAGLGLARYEDKRYSNVNDSFIAMFGLTREQALNRNGLELHTWVDVDARAAAMQLLERDGEIRNFEARYRTSGGDIFHASFSATRVSIGREDLVIASYFDLTAQRLATRTLEERKLELERIVLQRTAELSNILDAMPDLYFRMRRDGTIVDFRAGKKVELFLGPQDFLGRRVRDVLPPDAAEPIHAAIAQAFADTGTVIVEYPLTFKDTGEQYFEARLLPMGADQVIAFVRNITDRRSLEADRELARLNAVELANAKSEFLANMSHEIRTPLNGLLGLAQIGLRDTDDKRTRDTFAAILNSGQLLLGIVNDVLDFSKIEVGKLRVEQRPFSPRALAEEGVALLRERADAKGIALDLAFDPALPGQCLGDALRTQQVLVNLLSNAIKFTESGGVKVWVGLETDTDAGLASATPDDVERRPDGAPALHLVFRVADSGIGIAPEHLPQLFTAFQQADTSTTRRFGGTGLGLAISRRLAELMGGAIRVRSRHGAGSTFELRLPFIDESAQTSPPVAAVAWGDTPRRLAGTRVLVAEDNEVNQLVLERALTIEGAEVTIVGDGRQAVNRVLVEGRQAFDVVLMDIQMPEMDGYEATRRILELAPDLPVIGQTAHAMQDERRECLAAGMVDHIAKPIDFRQLVDMIERHVP